MRVVHGTVVTGSQGSEQVSKNEWNDEHELAPADVTVTNAQLLDLHNTHIPIIAAPGAGMWIHVISATGYFTRGGSGFSTDDDSPTLGYGNGFNIFNGNFKVHSQSDDVILPFNLSTGSNGFDPAEMVNKALNLEPVGQLSGGVGCSLRVIVYYDILSV
jgi:hypothetical protein